MAGKAEGRTPRHDLGFRYDIISSMQPLEKRIEHARTSAPKRPRTAPSNLRDALRSATRLETKGLYISVIHDDFTGKLPPARGVRHTSSPVFASSAAIAGCSSLS